jgi:hypothetical protein
MGCKGADEDVGERTIHPEREDGETLGVGTVPPEGMRGTPPARRSAAVHEWYHGVPSPSPPASSPPSTEATRSGDSGRGVDGERLQLDVDVTQEVDVGERGKRMTPFTVFRKWRTRSGAGGGLKLVGAEVDVMGCKGADEDVSE